MIGSQRDNDNVGWLWFEEQKPGQEMVEGEAKYASAGAPARKKLARLAMSVKRRRPKLHEARRALVWSQHPRGDSVLAAGVGLGVDLAAWRVHNPMRRMPARRQAICW